MLSLDVVPSLDPHGYAASNRPLALTVVPSHLDGSTPPTGGLRDVHLYLSPDNGTSWQPVPLIRTPDNRWSTLIPSHLLRHPGPVALRATATATSGATIDRTVTTAFTVR